MPDFGGNVARMQEFSALLELGLSKVFKDDLPTHPKLYTDWLTTKTANEFIEDQLVTTGFGPMPEKAIGGPTITDKPYISSPKDFEIVPYALGFVGEYELIRWDKYAVFTGITKKLTRSGVDRCNVLAYAIPNNSFSTTDPVYTTYAEEALCATSHALLRGGTGANRPSTDVDISYLGMQEAITDFALLTNEDGLYIKLTPRRVMCHPSKRWEAVTLLESDYRPDNANMAKNTLKSGGLGVHDSPYLSNTNYWWMMADKAKLEMSFDTGDSLTFRRDFQMSTWNNVFSMYASYRVAVLHWYGIWGTTGT
jgi:hypothetical protein